MLVPIIDASPKRMLSLANKLCETFGLFLLILTPFRLPSLYVILIKVEKPLLQKKKKKRDSTYLLEFESS